MPPHDVAEASSWYSTVGIPDHRPRWIAVAGGRQVVRIVQALMPGAP